MFLFESIPWYAWAAWFAVLAALILLNEITRRSKWVGIGVFVALPIVLTIFVWPTTAGEGSATGSWFHWVKVYSALVGVLGFMAIRYIPKLAANKWALLFPPAILAINILEACIRDFQVGAMGADGMVDGVYMVSGPWNYMNGIAGIINLITICGWMGIIVSRDSSRDMVWPDMLWFWIIAYDLWNFAYVYNCVGDHSFYAGAALLICSRCRRSRWSPTSRCWCTRRTASSPAGSTRSRKSCTPICRSTSRCATRTSRSTRSTQVTPTPHRSAAPPRAADG